MSQEPSMPASIGANAEEPRAVEPDAALLRLHAALRELDDSIFKALRALESALGRDITSQPERSLPYREMGRLRDQLEAASRPSRSGGRPNFAELVLEDSDAESDDQD